MFYFVQKYKNDGKTEIFIKVFINVARQSLVISFKAGFCKVKIICNMVKLTLNYYLDNIKCVKCFQFN